MNVSEEEKMGGERMYTESTGAQAMKYLATKPTMIITTLHASGIVNAGVFGAWTNLSGEHVGIAVGTGSHTYANILREKEFVINIPGADLVRCIAVLAGSVPETQSELDAAGLTPKDGIAVRTPGIAECQAAAEFAFDREVEIGYHSLLIGTVKGGWIRDAALGADGRIDIFKARVIKDFKYPAPYYVLPGEVVGG
jgi:flavin reductase (DIM6/NTAB) family NADH-FMN oxidoreductase RutF